MKTTYFFISFCLMIACSPPSQEDSSMQNDHNGVLLVANKSADIFHIFDRNTGDILAELETDLEPHEVEASPDGKWAVVSNYGDREQPGRTLSVYDVLKGELVRTIELGMHTRPHSMKWITGTDHLLVTTEGSQHLLKVNVASGEIILEMPVSHEVGHMVAASPDFSQAFVTAIRSGTVSAFDLSTGDEVSSVYSGAGAEGIDVSPGGQIWVTNRDDNTITIFDGDINNRIDELECPEFPIRIKFTPDGSRAVVSCAKSGDIAIFDALERTLITRVSMPPYMPSGEDDAKYFSDFEDTSIPIGLVMPDNESVFVASTRANSITEICLNEYKIIREIPAGKEPDGIHFSALRPESQR